MDGSFLGDLQSLEDFFTSTEKPPSVAVVSTASTGDHHDLGIYQNEESVDLSALLEACQDGSSNSTTTQRSYPKAVPGVVDPPPPQTSLSNFGSFGAAVHSPAPTSARVAPSLAMYGSEQFSVMTGPTEMPCDPTHRPPSDPTQPPAQYAGDPLAGTRPAPGKAKSSKKRNLDKNSEEYRMKRDRNNIAVRRSRQKTKIRVMETESRVKELEEENSQLQSKIALLSKELNVLKSLFTSAGVAQPHTLHIKEELGGHQ